MKVPQIPGSGSIRLWLKHHRHVPAQASPDAVLTAQHSAVDASRGTTSADSLCPWTHCARATRFHPAPPAGATTRRCRDPPVPPPPETAAHGTAHYRPTARCATESVLVGRCQENHRPTARCATESVLVGRCQENHRPTARCATESVLVGRCQEKSAHGIQARLESPPLRRVKSVL